MIKALAVAISRADDTPWPDGATVPAEGLPEHDFNLAPVGTGQFRVEEATSEHVILEANSNFYR